MKWVVGTRNKKRFVVFKIGRDDDPQDHSPVGHVLKTMPEEDAARFYSFKDARKVLASMRVRYSKESLSVFEVVETLREVSYEDVSKGGDN